jgi:membrane associated rhomboid family serine protease
MMRHQTWRLTEALVFMHLAVFFLTSTYPDEAIRLVLVPELVAVQPWSVVTFQFLHGGMISFFFSALVLWIMARPLEEEWGSPRFLLFWAVSIGGAAATAIVLGVPLAGDIFFQTSLLFTFATLYPDFELLLFFVLPVKVKYLALLGGAYLAVTGFRLGVAGGVAYLVGMSAGYVLFLITRRIPSRRKMVFERRKRRATKDVRQEHQEAESRNTSWDPSVRRAETETREAGAVPDGYLPLLQELDEAKDENITVCAPEEFGYIDDPTCRTCPGYAECAARRIRMAADESRDA